MKTGILVLAIILAITTLLAVPVLAQFEANDRSPLGISFGIFSPSGSQLSDLSSAWLGPMATYQTKFDSFDRPILTASIGWFGEEDTGDDVQDVQAKFIPITAAYTKYLGDNPDKGWYVSGELGFAFASYEKQKYDWGGSWDKESKTLPIYGAAVGYTFGKYYYANFNYFLSGNLNVPTVGDVSFDGWMISAGTRFTF